MHWAVGKLSENDFTIEKSEIDSGHVTIIAKK